MIRPMPGPGCPRGGLPRPDREQPDRTGHRAARQGDPGDGPPPRQQRQHREPDTENQCQPTEHPVRQSHPGRDRLVVTHQDVDTAAHRRGRMNDTTRRKTRMATTRALAPGSISRRRDVRRLPGRPDRPRNRRSSSGTSCLGVLGLRRWNTQLVEGPDQRSAHDGPRHGRHLRGFAGRTATAHRR